MTDLVLPAFEMDCRDWLVVSPSEAGMAEDVDGAPLLAVLTTAVIDDDIREASGALSVGLIDPDERLDTRQVARGAEAYELIDRAEEPRSKRYVMPAPAQRVGQRLALLAEFIVPDDVELSARIERLMTSFRWQPA